MIEIPFIQSAHDEQAQKNAAGTLNGRQVLKMNEDTKRTYKGPGYPTKEHGSIPAFNSYEEEAVFWDTHDFTDLEAETEPAKVVAARGFSSKVEVRLEPDTDHELEALALKKGMKKSTLIRTWILERLDQERQAS